MLGARPSRLRSLPTFAALRHPDYARLWSASVLSGVAAWTTLVGQGWLVFRLSDSSLWVGIVAFAAMAPFIIVTPFAGLLADRLDRRRVVTGAMAVSLALVAAMAVLTITDVVEVWHVVVLAFLGGAARTVEMPATQALIPSQVSPGHLLNALALTGVARHGSRFLGPAVAGPLLATVGVGGVFILGTGAALLALALVLRVRTVSRGAGGTAVHAFRDLSVGVVYAYRHSLVGLLIVLVSAHCALTMSFDAMLPAFAAQALGAGGPTYSSLVMGVGGGALLGTLWVATVTGDRIKGRMLLATGLLSGVTAVAMGYSTAVPVAVVSAMGMGASQAMFMALTNMYVIALVPDALRGRIAGVYLFHAGGVMAFANLAGGSLADAWAAAPLFLLGGAAFVGVFLLVSAGRPVLRQLYRTGSSGGLGGPMPPVVPATPAGV